MFSPNIKQESMLPAHSPEESPSPRRSNSLRAGAILALTILLAIIFGTGLFAGWQFGRSNAPTEGPITGVLQPGTAQGAAIPPPTELNIESIRKAAIAKVRPAVVQVNVITQRGSGLGSGVILDRRGYIVTNNHV